MAATNKEWSLSNIPPKGDKDVAAFANSLFEISRVELERINKHDDFLANYSLYRGQSGPGCQSGSSLTPVNLYFSNIERTIANITARSPSGEVVDMDGFDQDGAEDILNAKLQKWWKETNQQTKVRTSARTMEIYGITVEKPAWNKEQERPDIVVTDPYGFYPAPGFYEEFDLEAPFISYAYLKYIDKVEAEFNVKNLVPDEAYDLLGTVREEYKGQSGAIPNTGYSGVYEDPLISAGISSDQGASDRKLERCLIKEVWVRDGRTKTVTEEHPVIDPDTGMPQVDEKGVMVIQEIKKTVPVYPDGIRKITISAVSQGDTGGYVVLDDCANPNINPNLDIELAKTTHPWGRLPAYHANSYKDLVSPWGFAAAEQVGDLIVKINKIISRLINYVTNVMSPPLIVQKNCGISREMITSALKKGGRLILMPTTPNARIEFMQIPNLPSTFFQVLEIIVGFFDRVYAIESADRGQAPRGVIAAAAIVSLQERNQELMQSKTAAIEALVENRSRWCVGLYQNFGTKTEYVDVASNPAEFVGTNFAGRKFSYVVEAGSTTPRTSLQMQEIAKWLWQTKAIDQRAVLEIMNVPDWKNIVERTGETQLDQALQILIDSGMPEEEAFSLKQYLLQPNQGSGGENAVNGIAETEQR